jgi:hypothetical protein
MTKRFLFFALAALAALLLNACTIQVATEIKDDGSGSYGFEMGFNQEDQEALTSLGSSPEAFCQEMQGSGDLPEGATITIEERGGETFCVMQGPFANLAELRTLYIDGDGVAVNTLEMNNGALTYDVDVNMSGGDTAGIDPTAINMAWKVTVPGTVGNNNADTIEGNTLTWKLTPGQSRNVHVESSTGGFGLGGFGTLETVVAVACSCLCCVALLGGAGGGLYFFTQRNKKAGA